MLCSADVHAPQTFAIAASSEVGADAGAERFSAPRPSHANSGLVYRLHSGGSPATHNESMCGGQMGILSVVWLPGQESRTLNYTPVPHPRTGEPLAVPALIIPEYAGAGA